MCALGRPLKEDKGRMQVHVDSDVKLSSKGSHFNFLFFFLFFLSDLF